MNMDIGQSNWYQHPHIQSNWSCCLGEYISPMRTSFSKQDYITLVGFFIEFLESLNEHSVYQSMVARQDMNYKRFIPYLDKQPKVSKAKANGESPNIIIIDDPDATPEPDVVLSYNWIDNLQRVASPGSELIVNNSDVLTDNNDVIADMAQADSDRIDAEIDEQINEDESNANSF